MERYACEVAPDETGQPLQLHLLRPRAEEGAWASAFFSREVQILKLLNHENVVGLAGTVVDARGAVVGALVPSLPHSLPNAWAGQPRIIPAQHRSILLEVCRALEFLGARRFHFAQLQPADVLLSATATAKLQCYGLRPEDQQQGREGAVVLAFGRLAQAALKAVPMLASDRDMAAFARDCSQGTIKTLCDLTLEAQQV